MLSSKEADVSRGSIYELEFVDTEFRAEGMHEARRIEATVRAAIRMALAGCDAVLVVERGPYVRMKASRKNFAPTSNQEGEPK